jgi:hypothetical protein
MPASYAELSHALESLDGKLGLRAFTSAAELVPAVEVALESYLDSTEQLPHLFCEFSSERLWLHFAQLQAAVDAHALDAAWRAVEDLKAAVRSHHQGTGPGTHATA